MIDAPERIWAVQGLGEVLSCNTYDNGETEYIRADLHAALEAENAALREALGAVRAALIAFGTPKDSEGIKKIDAALNRRNDNEG